MVESLERRNFTRYTQPLPTANPFALMRLSQTGKYIFELLKKVCNLTLLIFLSISEHVRQWVDKIGANRWSGVTSDNAANCSKAWRLLAEYNPRILNMADACHNLHNACKDICNLPEFKEVLFLSYHGFSSWGLTFINTRLLVNCGMCWILWALHLTL